MLDQLRRIVGTEHVVVDPDITKGSTVDWTGRFRGSTPAVVRPGSVDEVASVVQFCAREGWAIVPQGGNTGLVGGGVPLDNEIVLSLTRLSEIRDVDAQAGQLTASAGATVSDVQAAASRIGWAYGVDFGARESATVGGTVATNAGGARVVRYGDTRAQLVGVEAVLGDGSVISHLGGAVKESTGYDVGRLLCGSEGTLGVVTAARLRLVPAYKERVVALAAFPSVDAAVTAVGFLRRTTPALDAIELMLDEGLQLVCSSFELPRPFSTRGVAYLLVECAAEDDPVAPLARAMTELDPLDVAVASDEAGRSRLWRYREAHTEAINLLGPPHKLDVTLPAATIGSFIHEIGTDLRSVPGAAAWFFGHAAEGNLHVNITGLRPDDHLVDEAVLSRVAQLGGSIGAEHGIGTAKRRWLHLSRTAPEIDAMRAIKATLDPSNILNPNVLLP